jgi:hypothetical protein
VSDLYTVEHHAVWRPFQAPVPCKATFQRAEGTP